MNKALVEQAGGDERAAFELFVRKHCGMPAHIAVNWDAKFTNDAWDGWQARAALAQPSPKCVKCGGTGEADSGGVHPWGEPILIPCDCETEKAEAERPEVVAYADPVAFARFKERGHEGGVAGREWMWAEPTPGLVAMSRTDECERIVGELRAEIAKLIEALDECDGDRWNLRSERDAANTRLHEVATACATAEQERDAALARVAELEGKLTDWVHEGFRLNEALAVAKAQHSVPIAPELKRALGLVVAALEADGDRPTSKYALSELKKVLAAAHVCHLSRNALTEAQMRRLYENSTETENERLGFEAFARLIRRAEAVHQITAAPGKEGV
ncbi:hypothetical protein [Pseudomonas aeruginosa]